MAANDPAQDTPPAVLDAETLDALPFGGDLSGNLDRDQVALDADPLVAGTPTMDMDTLAALAAFMGNAGNAGAAGAESDDAEPGGRPRRKTAAIKIKLTRDQAKLAADVAGFYALLGFGVSALWPLDGAIIMAGADDRAKELVFLASKHDTLYQWLVAMTRANAYAPFVLGHGGMILALLAVHGHTPASLAARMRANFTRPASAPRPSRPHAEPGQPPEAQQAAQATADADTGAAQMALLQALQAASASANGYSPLSHVGGL